MGNYAGINKRLAALFIDYLLIVIYALILVGAAIIFYNIFFDGIPDTGRVTEELISFFALVFPVFLYFVITESSQKRASFGKRKMRIGVGSFNGNSLSLVQVILRNVIKLLPWQAAHSFIFYGMHNHWEISAFTWIIVGVLCYGLPIISFLLLCFRKDHRVIHDLLANTVVHNRSR
ncbi:RDD family protein [Virgibacillus doumboii]|uniref:RDD family protein n=1 Tax=Virgibacillus doumboii TaxID=2697503 RepID=UPI0013E03FBD|nr:RDD family protein [Virgibacillus doumboii]